MFAEITVYWCLAFQIKDRDDFNPHSNGGGAVANYVKAHPGICGISDPEIVEVTMEECQQHSVLYYVPQWEAHHPGKMALGAPCSEYDPHRLDIRPEDQRATQ